MLGNAVAHQLWVCRRAELQQGLLSAWLGRRAFTLHAAVFTVLILSRPVLACLLSAANKSSLPWNPAPSWTVAALLALPLPWLAFSIVKYFSFRRAYGIDHFDESIRGAALVRRGIFRVSGNAR